LKAELTRKRLERANKLTSGLSEEGVRWRATAEQLQMQIGLLVGDVFISAACIAYYGAFTGSFRWADQNTYQPAAQHPATCHEQRSATQHA
jgi:hypothetical protein